MKRKNENSSTDSLSSNEDFLMLQQPSILKNGQLKEFQLTGLNWMINLYEIGTREE
jgi:hypothetical protein